jgi:spore maturation protein SpmA
LRFRGKSKKTASDWSIASTSRVNVGLIKNSEASLFVEVSSAIVTPRLATLNVQVKNEGKCEINNLYILANVSNGYSLNNPGEIFGTSLRMEKIKKLNPTQVIKFKLALKGNEQISPAFLNVFLASTPNETDPEAVKVSLELRTIPFN